MTRSLPWATLVLLLVAGCHSANPLWLGPSDAGGRHFDGAPNQNPVDSGGGPADIASPPRYNVVNVNSGKLMTVANAVLTDGAGIVQKSADGSAIQQWELYTVGSSTMFVNVASGKALEVPAQSTMQGVQLDQWSVNGGTNQLWTLTANGNYETIANGNSKLLLDVNAEATVDSAPIIQWPATGRPNQQWQLMLVH
jgi:hypothetical protein